MSEHSVIAWKGHSPERGHPASVSCLCGMEFKSWVNMGVAIDDYAVHCEREAIARVLAVEA